MDEILILERTIELLVAAGHVAQEKVEEARQLAISLTEEAAEQNEEIAEELLQVLYEKMWFRGPLEEEWWAIEKICAALNAAQQATAPDAASCAACGRSPLLSRWYCPECGLIQPPRR